MLRFFGNIALFTFLLAPLTGPAAAQPCDPVVYQSADPDCWGQHPAHKDFTTEFDVHVDRVWQGPAEGAPDYTLLWTYVTRQDTGQQLIFKWGWSNDETNVKRYDLAVGQTYRVRAASGYGYVYVHEPVGGTLTWVETPCALENQAECL